MEVLLSEFALSVPSRLILGLKHGNSPSSSLGAIVLRGLKRIRDWLTKHSKVDESWQNLACARKLSAKPGGRAGELQDFPLSPSFSP